MNTTIRIDFKPKESDLSYIMDWLYSENIKTETGFYCNRNIIKTCFVENRMAIISVNKYAIGFITWGFHTAYSAGIGIAEIHPAFRKFGYGKILANHLFLHFKDNNILTVDLECAPANSAHFWKKLKFKEFPKDERWERHNIELYKILVDYQKPKVNTDTESEIIELWNGEPNETIHRLPVWQLQIKYKKGLKQFTEPIIFPCNYDWRIRWRKGDKVIFDEKVKRFNKIKIPNGRYLILENM